MSVTLARPTIIVNNSPILIVPNSTVYTEGKGEQNVRTQSAGGGAVDIVTSENVETNMTKANFSIFPTEENIALARSWKSNGDKNAIDIVSGTFSRSITNASLINDYEVNLGADTTIDLEFIGAPAV
jgi:hypothetical protein